MDYYFDYDAEVARLQKELYNSDKKRGLTPKVAKETKPVPKKPIILTQAEFIEMCGDPFNGNQDALPVKHNFKNLAKVKDLLNYNTNGYWSCVAFGKEIPEMLVRWTFNARSLLGVGTITYFNFLHPGRWNQNKTPKPYEGLHKSKLVKYVPTFELFETPDLKTIKQKYDTL